MAPTLDELVFNISFTDSIEPIKRENLGMTNLILKDNVVICCSDLHYRKQLVILSIITVICVIIAIGMYIISVQNDWKEIRIFHHSFAERRKLIMVGILSK